MNILFVSHCDFNGNSGMHLFSIANALEEKGVSCAIAVPHRPESIEGHGAARFIVTDHATVARARLRFRDGRGPALVHAWTPRELVRKVALAAAGLSGCPYAVHLEDNEEVILEDELGAPWRELAGMPEALVEQLVPVHRTYPVRGAQFVGGASGVSALLDRLLEFRPEGMPSAVFWPGFDEQFLELPAPSPALEARVARAQDERLVVYTGNVHGSNAGEVRSLYLAIAALRRRGVAVRLLKTGWDYGPKGWADGLRAPGSVTELGFLPRAELPSLLSMADALVQPGRADRFNEYRFPSKLPEYLASGKPVILPRANIGHHLSDGREALLLEEGHAVEIAEKLELLFADPELGRRIAAAGGEFARRELRWSVAAERLLGLYERIASPADAGEVCARPMPAGRPLEAGLPAKVVAFYLPHFHPTAETDARYGKGFTDWTAVTRARPQFPGHHQPQLPADLGFYDLRVPEILHDQARLARAHGVTAFCFYYYWFGGKRVLDGPLQTWLQQGPDFPFCLCWANESWTRRRDGSEDEVLLEQRYEEGWEEQFIRDALTFLRDPRYLRVNGAPVLLVYRVDELPDPHAAVARWRQIAEEEGIGPLHLAAVQSFGLDDPRPRGFDAAVELPPHTKRELIDPAAWPGIAPTFAGKLESYPAVVRNQLARTPPDYVHYRGVMPAWDDTARRGNHGHVLVETSPEIFRHWTAEMVRQSLGRVPSQEALLFVNAWNAWADGAHLEPDQRHGHAWLEALRDGLCAGISAHYGDRSVPLSPELVRRAIDEHLSRRGEEAPMPERRLVEAAAEPELAAPSAPVAESSIVAAGAGSLTAGWFSREELSRLHEHYRRTFRVPPLGYATVRDFCDSHDRLRPLATASGDLKDCQRPWMLKALFALVPRGGRVLEIGAGEPFVGALLGRLGFDVWIVDPYDGTGNGPQDYERFRRECPGIHFVRSVFGDGVAELEPRSFDAIYSISVLEHVPADALPGLFAGTRRLLRAGGCSLHAVDHVHRGTGAEEHRANLTELARRMGVARARLDATLAAMDADTDTCYLSAEAHNRWRGAQDYDRFPMRVCVSVQLAAAAEAIR